MKKLKDWESEREFRTVEVLWNIPENELDEPLHIPMGASLRAIIIGEMFSEMDLDRLRERLGSRPEAPELFRCYGEQRYEPVAVGETTRMPPRKRTENRPKRRTARWPKKRTLGDITPLSVWHFYSFDHSNAASLFSIKCADLEANPRPPMVIDEIEFPIDPGQEREHRSYAISSILSSVAFLEASLNELLASASDDYLRLGGGRGPLTNRERQLLCDVRDELGPPFLNKFSAFFACSADDSLTAPPSPIRTLTRSLSCATCSFTLYQL
jgi:hypothetical protein